VQSAANYDSLAARKVEHCNVCDWQGAAFDVVDDQAVCPSCSSTPFMRSAMRCLSMSGELQRRPKVTYLGEGAPLRKALDRLCPDFLVVPLNPASAAMSGALEALGKRTGVLLIDHADWGPDDLPELIEAIARRTEEGGLCIVGERLGPASDDASILEGLVDRGLKVDDLTYVSRCAGYDRLAVGAIGFHRATQEGRSAT
jgi:hypothetical protein